MTSLKECMREVRDAAVEQLESSHGAEAESKAQNLSREEALATVALVTIRLLESELQQHRDGDAAEAAIHALQVQLKACRKALKCHVVSAAAAAESSEAPPHAKRARGEKSSHGTSATAAPARSGGPSPDGTSKSDVDLGQYASTDAFNQNEQKRLKFARLMGGAKAGAVHSAGASAASHHNTFAANNAEVQRMNANLESQFESAMTHKGKKGLGA